jgi:putative peptidoglycan lipid II flippase
MSKRLLKTTSIFASVTLVARTLGFVRDTILAQLFGTNATVDAFYVAFKVLASLRGFVENPLSQVFVPVLSEYREKASHDKVKRLVAATIGTFGSALFIIVAIGMLTTPYWLAVFVPGLDDYRFQLANYFIRIVLPYLFFIALCALGVGAMNTYGKPWGVALTPIWLSLSLIGTALWLSKYCAIPIAAQAWGVLIAGVFQILFVATYLKRLDLLAMPRIAWRDEGVKKVVKLMLPAFIGASATQIGLLINTNLASFLSVGTISWIYYADRLIYFPVSVIAFSLSIAVLSPLSKYHATGAKEDFISTLGWGLRCNLLVALPVAITMGMLSGPLVVSLFAYGKFTAFDVLQTQQAVLGYVLGVPAFMLAKTLQSAFYAQQNTSTLSKVVLWVAPFNALLGVILVPWIHQGGITLAGSLSAWLQISLLIWQLKRPIEPLLRPPLGWRRWIISMCVMGLTLSTFFYFATPELTTWLQWNWSHRLMRLGLLGLGGALISIFAFSYSVGFKARLLLNPA